MFQAHTDGDIYVFFPGPNILMAGDVLSVGKYPILDYSTHGWIGGMANANRDLLQIVDARQRSFQERAPYRRKPICRLSSTCCRPYANALLQ